MEFVQAVYKLYWKCPHCGKRNTLKNRIEYIPLRGVGDFRSTIRCWKCAVEVGVEPAGGLR